MLEINLCTVIVYGDLDCFESLMVLILNIDRVQILLKLGIEDNHPSLHIIHVSYAKHSLHVPHGMSHVDVQQLTRVHVG